MTCEGLPWPEHQQLLRELGIIDYVVEVLRRPFRKRYSQGYKLTNIKTENPRLYHICCLAYRLLEWSFRDNRKNELYAANYMRIIISHLGYDLGAERTLTR